MTTPRDPKILTLEDEDLDGCKEILASVAAGERTHVRIVHFADEQLAAALILDPSQWNALEEWLWSEHREWMEAIEALTGPEGRDDHG